MTNVPTDEDTVLERTVLERTVLERTVLERTRHWLVQGVIGLNLCPFARAVHVNGRLRYRISSATTESDLLDDLAFELQHLQQADSDSTETTLLIHPCVLADFLDFNRFLDRADALLVRMSLEGILQIATFHPDYEFADLPAADVGNCTNRSPYPILHLLRESSIQRATETMSDTADIYRANLETMRGLGMTGWQTLMEWPANPPD